MHGTVVNNERGGGGKLTCDVAQGPNGLLTDVVVG